MQIENPKTSQTWKNIPLLNHINSGQFLLLAGPCVVESEQLVFQVAESLKNMTDRLKIPLVFKASYRKANRSKQSSFTGIGDEKALEILAKVREKFQLPIVTDVHLPEECALAAQYIDVLQIPAFLCRQTDLLEAAAQTGKVINIKKGQFMSPEAMQFAVEKVKNIQPNLNVLLTERGTTFGYNDLIVDFRSLPIMQSFAPVLLDVTHSLQQPNQTAGVTGGLPHFIETLAKAAIAINADGLFIETHPNPKEALSDGANMLPLAQMEKLLEKLIKIRQTIINL